MYSGQLIFHESPPRFALILNAIMQALGYSHYQIMTCRKISIDPHIHYDSHIACQGTMEMHKDLKPYIQKINK